MNIGSVACRIILSGLTCVKLKFQKEQLEWKNMERNNDQTK